MKNPNPPTSKAVDLSATLDWLVVTAAVLGLAFATYSIVRSTTSAPNDRTQEVVTPERALSYGVEYRTSSAL